MPAKPKRSILSPQIAIAVSFAALIVSAPAYAQETQEKIEVGDVSRTFIVHLPQGYDKEQHYPVVILLHGENQDADDLSRLTHFSQFAEKNAVIAVYPNALRAQWNIGVRPEAQPEMARNPYGRRRYGGGYPGGGGGGYPGGGGGGYPSGQRGDQNPDENGNHAEPADDIAFLNQMLDQLALKYSIDSHRVYAVGLGDGGFMALKAACSASDRIAAVAAVSAELPKTMICLPSRPVAALFIEGTSDPVTPYSGGTYKPGRFRLLSAEDSSKEWAKFDHCSEKPAEGKIPAPEKGAKETKTLTFSGCGENAQVMLYSVKDGGHTWPGGEQFVSEGEVGKVSHAINANEVVWSFLSHQKIAGENQAAKQ
jgi:polyhydroxybutyrate depolymerase